LALMGRSLNLCFRCMASCPGCIVGTPH